MLNWTKDTTVKGKTVSYAKGTSGGYVATRRSGRHYLVYGPDGGDPVVLGNGSLAKVKELAQAHEDKLTQTTQTPDLTQSPDPVADAINSPQDAAQPVASPEPAPTGPDAPAGQPSSLPADPSMTPPPLPDEPITPLDTPRPDPTRDVLTMPSAAQKTAQKPAKATAKKAAKKPAKAKADKTVANGQPVADATPAPADDAGGDEPLTAPLRDPGDMPIVTKPGNPEKAPGPKELTPQSILDWAEFLREKHAQNKYFLALEGLFAFARACCGDKSGQVIRILKQLYRNERQAPAAPPADPKPAKKPAKAKADPKPAKAAKAKADKTDPKTPKRGRGRPPKDGVKAQPRNATEYKIIEIKPNKFGIPVTAKVSKKSGKAHLTVFDISPRAIMRWMGHDGWSVDQVRTAIEKLGLMRFFVDNKQDHFPDQVASGRKGNKDQGGWAGDLPTLTDDQQKKLRAIKPKD